ncbi:FMN-binding protein [Anoxynatronum buryatiense]|uniref:FMN-binding domain-containing protein n=1 Tax=Anoxynatronum buryatiense TaxID=489973 RepID=A0AA45WVK9_9CLOT|nr:FMN-binding protein [Anoxynatronum buryatiense]SMP53717.1 FMN-binding domain-containing protein [Anoxynatronum buryatiense]
MKRALKMLGAVVLVLILIAGGMFIYLTRGLSEGASLPLEGIDLSETADGTYGGRYEGGRWSNQVEVTVENHRITRLEVVEDIGFVQEGFSQDLFSAVIAAQDTRIDTVSGATVTTKAYLKAIENALKP